DPQIYLDTLRQYPERVKAIYIRDSARGRHRRTIRRLSEQARQLGIDLLLVQDTLAVAQHAARHGYIAPEMVDAVRTEIHTSQKPWFRL
ncbi:MAG: hypothetical protein JW966_15285, partial [Anaerolineae bacterium]|nr:hypothetical protein [Anaerolineae bacterium]